MLYHRSAKTQVADKLLWPRIKMRRSAHSKIVLPLINSLSAEMEKFTAPSKSKDHTHFMKMRPPQHHPRDPYQGDGAQYSSNRDAQVARAREIDQLSTVLIDYGVKAVKRNPIKVSLYVVGLLICLLFNGIQPSPEASASFENQMTNIDYRRSEVAGMNAEMAYQRYYNSKGWFSCNELCQENKKNYETLTAQYKREQAIISDKLSDAKSTLGLFSDFGVQETRSMFWEKFGMGKSFATRQTKFDALFMGIGAMGRDETIVNYALRLIIRALFNFTLGVCMAVLTFVGR
jgi:hypothetical protein